MSFLVITIISADLLGKLRMLFRRSVLDVVFVKDDDLQFRTRVQSPVALSVPRPPQPYLINNPESQIYLVYNVKVRTSTYQLFILSVKVYQLL